MGCECTLHNVICVCVCVLVVIWLYGAISLIRFILFLFLWQKTSSELSEEKEKDNEEAIEKMRLSHLQVNILNFPVHSKRFGFMLCTRWTNVFGMNRIRWTKMHFNFFFLIFLCLSKCYYRIQILLNFTGFFSRICITFFVCVSWCCVHSTEKKASHF